MFFSADKLLASLLLHTLFLLSTYYSPCSFATFGWCLQQGGGVTHVTHLESRDYSFTRKTCTRISESHTGW
ncbi:hypothetical protein GcC1_c14401o15 [Golovinomyces cichoracearum]|uniref:Secreted protein n=1 Tax=Golovinomyces cichoracearum TaxID=62708 RepID=A0A420J142_9PEZI|nr:hypothetical protein GcC1_c14401o15 [Golovinomyces cichoracearum]